MGGAMATETNAPAEGPRLGPLDPALPTGTSVSAPADGGFPSGIL